MSEDQLGLLPGDELLAKALAGDESALSELLGRLRPFMKRVASRTTPQRADWDSSDVVQNAQTKAWKSLGQFRGDGLGEFCGWLKSIVSNAVITIVRRGATHQMEAESNGARILERQAAKLDTPSQEAIRKENRDHVSQAILRLPPKSRDVILMRDFEGLKYEEIGEVLALSPTATRQRYSRALKELQEELERSRGQSGGQP